ncbi:serine/threonine-protein kinase [Allochromatium palmeri]|uniref:Protein kinase n=1 Tax=Allochromatium palmeri TaxID=231048 RepID=A0A6N8EG79_9GAMM|nr:serine/threonine-protein kinase [Allochromatium palmeri]MTW23223.1 protein kinase [Allochromatium palmeri]
MEAAAESRCPNCFTVPLSTPCRRCGWASGLDNPPPALALGTLLDGRYRIGRVLGHGGFGITYLAWDENLHLRLAIKEYLPRDSATRAPDGVSLAVYSGPAAEQFAYGLERFLEEARALARFDQHPGIVTVKSFFRAHGTGYCVMDYVEGLTFKQYLAQQPDGRLAFDQALKLLMPVMDALRAVHKDGLLHRDITPDNIYLTRSGRVKLLDFGAARFAAGEHSRSLSVILKPGYAPEEQYRTRGQQGPWTDVYSLAATLYRAITGQVPPDALDRLESDELMPPSRLGAGIRPEQEAVLLKALAVRAVERFESVEALQRAWKEAASSSSAPEQNPIDSAASSQKPSNAETPRVTQPSRASNVKRKPNVQKKRLSPLILLIPLLVVFAFLIFPYHSTIPVSPSPTYSLPTPDASSPASQPNFADGMAAFDRGDYQQAFAIWQPLAEQGDANAQFYLGKMYFNGQGVAKDYSQALQWYRKSAKQGFAQAQNNLGSMYTNGEGVAQDDAQAVQWYRKAAAQGADLAQFNLGLMYAKGQGVAQDYSQAVQWFRKAAEQGDAEAQFSLGVMYANGLVPRTLN